MDEIQSIIHVDYTFSSHANGRNAFSTIDHFACSIRLLPGIVEAGVIHDGGNPSNHPSKAAIYAKFDFGQIDLKMEEIKAAKRVDWDKATEEAKVAYKNILAEKLDSLIILIVWVAEIYIA